MRFTAGRLHGSTLEGSLTVRDVTLPGSFTARATTRIDRTEFGVTARRGLAGRYLDVAVEVRCVRI